MAVLIPEAAEAVAGGETAVSGTAAAGRASAGKAAAPLPAARKKAKEPYQKPDKPFKVQQEGFEEKPPQDKERRKKTQEESRKGRSKKIRLPAGKSVGTGRYQPVILAEFLVAVLVISIPPLAKGGDPTAQAKGSPSPYSTDTLKQLIAAGAVYFILALLSGSQKLGKFSAWFGGLTLLGIGLLQTANGDLTALFKIFGPSDAGANQQASPADQAAAGQVVSGALSGALGAGGQTVTVPNPDATGLFPVIEPGGQVFPASTANVILPPAGGNGVTTTTGNDAGANLA